MVLSAGLLRLPRQMHTVSRLSVNGVCESCQELSGTTMCGTMRWDGQPGNPLFSYCPSMTFSLFVPHCANARRNRCQEDHNCLPLGELEETTRKPSSILRGWRLFSKTWNPIISPWIKQLIWLRIVHSGDWCLCLALRTPSGACWEWWCWYVHSVYELCIDTEWNRSMVTHNMVLLCLVLS